MPGSKKTDQEIMFSMFTSFYPLKVKFWKMQLDISLFILQNMYAKLQKNPTKGYRFPI